MKVGLGGVVGKYGFRLSAEYSKVRNDVFAQDKMIMEALYDQPLYRCRLDTENQELYPSAQTVVDSGEYKIEKLGTHLIIEVYVGGEVKLNARLDSCVARHVNRFTIVNELKTLLWKLPLTVNEELSYTVGRSCVINYSFSETSKSAKGGTLSLLNEEKMDPWYQSIFDNPALLRGELGRIDHLVPGIDSGEIQSYLDQYDTEDNVTVSNPSRCECMSSGKAIISNSDVGAIVLFMVVSMLAGAII